MIRVAIATLGCKANQYDSEIIREGFEEKNFGVVPFSDVADIYVINTCTVTGKTDYQSRQLIRRAHRKNPKAKIVVTGCYAQVAPDDLEKIPGVSLVVGNQDKNNIPDLLLSSAIDNDARIAVKPFEKGSTFPEDKIKRFFNKTRFSLKIQDGCNARCSYCIIPTSRGPSRSMNPRTVLELLKRIGLSGYKEVILTGIHLGAYGLDLKPATTLLELLEKIEKEKPVPRIRLSSIEPNEVEQNLIDFIGASEMICPHLHLPLQSGDSDILRRMNRPYSAEYFHRLIKNLVVSIPDLAIGVDVIVGFPGEEERQFQQTFELINELEVTYLHVFPFSPRKGTAAARFPKRIDGNTVKSRGKLLRALGTEKRNSFYKSYLNKKLHVLIESQREKDRGFLKGFSRNYIPVLMDGGNELVNKEVAVRVSTIDGAIVNGVMEK